LPLSPHIAEELRHALGHRLRSSSGKTVVKTIVVPGRMVNFVVK
jgi:hypothetical protein